MKKILILASVVMISTLSHAWFMQPTDLFQTWSAQNKTPQTLLVKQERDLIVDGAVTQTIPETVKIKRPGLYKWTSEMPGLEEMKLLGKSKATMGPPRSQRDVPMKNVLTPIEVVVLYTNAGSIDSVLKQIEIDVKQAKLELISKNKEVRIGDAKGNRLYVSPDTGMLDVMAFQGRLYLIKYNKEKFSMYPSEIEIYENDVLKEKVRTKSVLTNAKLSDAEFEVR
jgi:outer membrane lipoprotein-sorting protein